MEFKNKSKIYESMYMPFYGGLCIAVKASQSGACFLS